MRTAYSLIRYSSWKQKKGDSKRRQMTWAPVWCERNGCRLDESLHDDRPVSAFRGANRTKGALASFLEMVKIGRVAKGSILLVESLDRLSREEIDEALTLFLGILKAGIEIVTMIPERRYTKASVGDLVGLLEPIIVMTRAHEESMVKSKRIVEVWEQRREKARSPKRKPMNSIGPAWLRMVDGRWEVIEERAAVIRLIFWLAIEGHGLHVIARKLNRDKVPPIGRAAEWSYSYIGVILRNRAVLGEFQPHVVRGRRVPDGKAAVAGYYPAIVTESTFHRAQAALDGRKNQKGPRGKYVRNLFTGLLRDARDGCTMVTVSESDKCKTVKLVSSGAARGTNGSTYQTFPLVALEEAFLACLKELKPSDILPPDGNDSADEIAALTGRLQELEHRIARTLSDLQQHGEFEAGLRLLRDLEADKQSVAGRLDKAKAEAATAEAEVLGEAQSIAGLLADAAGEELLSLRTKIKARLRDLIEEMRLLVVPCDGVRLGALQVWFKGGEKRRDYLVCYRRGKSYGEARQDAVWSARSLATTPGAGDLDLRKPDHARKLEKLLLSLELEG